MKDTDNIQISVLITFYNQKDYVSECLKSVLGQKTDFSYEILCGDNGSHDGTYEELLAWSEEYPDIIHVFRFDGDSVGSNEAIVRVSNCRYYLLNQANGRFICFLDGDDYYCNENKLQKQYDVLNSDPTLSGCFHPLFLRFADGSEPDKVLCNYSENAFVMPYKTYWGNMWSHVETFLFRNVFKENAIKINNDFFDDNLITAYFIRGGRIMYIPDPMSVYMQYDNSSWNGRSDKDKTVVNLLVYQESKRVLPELKCQCFTKCYDDIRSLYDSRNTDWNIKMDPKLILTEPVYKDTVRYKDSSAGFKVLYLLKWFLPIHFGKILKKIMYNLGKHTWKYVK